MKSSFFLGVVLVLVMVFCASTLEYGEPVVPLRESTRNTISWLYYERDYLNFIENYISLDESKAEISKNVFLDKLQGGGYIPVRLSSKKNSKVYQLFPKDSSISNEIVEIIKNKFKLEYKLYKMEGMRLPVFRNKDMDGVEYSLEKVKNKIVVINCWFTSCTPCVEEMPTLNKIVRHYSKRGDVEFVSFARDEEDVVKTFLEKTPFLYKTLPNMRKYLDYSLQIDNYPTHIIVNKEGVIVKVIAGKNIQGVEKILIEQLKL